MHGSAGTGLVMTYRAFDPVYKDTYPAGQLEIAIYTKDASTLSGWLTKHSGPVGSKDMTRYWTPTTNQSPVTVDGKPLPSRHDLMRISKTGFEWGFDGPAPAQLALALLADHLGDSEEALRLHRAFMREVVAHLDNAWHQLRADC